MQALSRSRGFSLFARMRTKQPKRLRAFDMFRDA